MSIQTPILTTALVITSLSLLSCHTVDGVSVLASAPDVECHTSEHKWFTVVGCIVLALVTVVVPLIVLVVNYVSVVGESTQHTGLSKVVHRVLGGVARSIQDAASTRLLPALTTHPRLASTTAVHPAAVEGGGGGHNARDGERGAHVRSDDAACTDGGDVAPVKKRPLLSLQNSGRSMSTDASSVSFEVRKC